MKLQLIARKHSVEIRADVKESIALIATKSTVHGKESHRFSVGSFLTVSCPPFLAPLQEHT